MLWTDIDPVLTRQLLVDEEMPQYAVAERLGVSSKTLRKCLRVHGIVVDYGKRSANRLKKHQQIHGNGRRGKPASEATRLRYSERQKRLWADPSYASRQRRALNDVVKSEAYRSQCRGREPRGSGYGKAGIRSDLGHHCRSSWEANYARFLRHFDVGYEYEPARFPVEVNGVTLSYTPDFRLSDGAWVEVKGFWRPHYAHKFQAFCVQYPDELVGVVGLREYRSIKQEFSAHIPLWEEDCV